MLLLAVSAILFQRSATAPWAEAQRTDGGRIAVTPIGLAQHEPGTTGTPSATCRWWPRMGDAELCRIRPGADDAVTTLRRAYPLTVSALWTSVFALFVVALSIPRSAPWTGTVVTAAVPVLALGALWSFATGAGAALSVLTDLTMHVAPRGFGPMFGGAMLSAAALGLLLVSRFVKRS